MARIFSFTAEGMLAKAASLAAEPLVRSWGLEAKLTGLHETLSLIQGITRDAADAADAADAKWVEWVEKLKDVANDADDVLDDINHEVLRHGLQIQNLLNRKVLNFISLSNPVAFRLKVAHQIKKINASLVDLKNCAPTMDLVSAPSQAMRSIRETNSSIGDEIIVGRDEAVSNILATLTSSEVNQEHLSVMAIVGMPGLGKTTLAKFVFNKLSTHFEEKIWIYVSYTFDVDSILNRILESVKCGTVDTQSQEAVLKSLREQLTEKRCLLVLDDVWNEDYEKWKKLMSCLSELHFERGSTILVTTCSSKVATITGTLPRYDLGFLSEDECWSILKERAFVDDTIPTDPDLEKVGREIARECAGLPSVAKVFGGMLRSKNKANEWSAILYSKIWDLPEAEEMIISGLKLSIDNLKFPILKQCFTYCSMFKKGFEIERDDLIQLWMAQGLIHPSSEHMDLEMEDIGTKYFNILLQNSLLQDLTKDAFGVVAKCKMHVLVHDFAELLSKYDIATSNSNEMVDTLKIQHASHIPTSVLELIQKKSLRGLRSLFSNNEVPSNMLLKFRSLHVLNLYNASITELPKAIEKLKQLRYLNVSRTQIKAIPKSVGKLVNLQTLRMEYCRLLKEFPQEIGDLINLRHIYFGPVQKKKRANFDWCTESHVRVGQLTNLRKMPYFIVSPYGIGRGIEELASLNHLKDELAIYDLEHVRDGEEAKKSNLDEKRNIRKLSLVWGEEMRPRNNSEEDVLQGLQPHPNLEILEICNFMGAKFPSWKQHINLKKIQLIQCDVCEEAPMLGHLPSLMHLEFNTMGNLKRLGDKFYGYYDNYAAMNTKALYPALKTFRISAAPNLIEWNEPPVVKEKQISVFPCLEELDLVECPQMRNFPDHFASIRKLDMNICHELSNLTSLVEKCTSLKNLEISNCDKLRSISLFGLTSIQKLLFSSGGDELTSKSLHSGPELYGRVSLKELSIKCPYLENLEISCCNSLMSISIHDATSLRGLKISSCGGLRLMDLQSLPECYTPLQVLSLSSCKSLESISSLRGCTSLHELTIEDCDGLKTYASIGLESCTSIRVLRVHDLQQLRQYAADGLHISLIEELTISKSPKVISISNHGLMTLRKLVLVASCVLELSIVNSITMEELYLQDYKSFDSLCIDNCERLRHVSVDGLETLIILKELTLRNCPSLTFIPITSRLRLERLKTDGIPNSIFIPIVAYLRELVIEGFEKLSSLPSGLKHCKALERLKISGSRNLVSIPISDVFPPSLVQFVIEDCAQISSLSGCHESLEELSIVNCPMLRWSSVADEGRSLTALRRLVIEGCEKLSSLLSGLKHCNALERLKISGSRNLVSIPISDVFPPSLRKFVIEDCAKLSSLPGRHESLEEFSIVNCPMLKWSSVADEGRSLFTIQRLVIASRSRPELNIDSISTLEEICLHDCISLSELRIRHCQNLREISSHNCTSLGQFVIEDCAQLSSLLGRHESLKELSIVNCPMLRWSSVADEGRSLIALQRLVIEGCENLSSLPSGLKHCNALERLKISGSRNLVSIPISDVFPPSLGQFVIKDCAQLSSLPGRHESLEKLSIMNCPMLRWSSVADEGRSLTAFRRLVIASYSRPELKIDSISTLEEICLHDCTSLGELRIQRCQNLREISLHDCTSLRQFVIEDCAQLSSLPGRHESLEELSIVKCPMLRWSSVADEGKSLIALRRLVIEGCENLSILPSGLKRCNALKRLKISGSRNLVSIPISDVFPPFLGQFEIEDCAKLSSLPGRHESLEEMSIVKCPMLRWSSVTDDGRSLTALRRLVIEDCEKLSSLLSWLKHCNALERLKISGSQNLVSIPISDVFPPSLGQFVIEDCAQLSSLPGRHESLEELCIVSCPMLRRSSVANEGRSLTALRRLVIASCSGPKLNIDSISTLEEICLHDCTSLGELRIRHCQKLRNISLHDCTSLGKLRLQDCQNLKALPSLDNLTSLGDLSIVGCDGLTGLPSGLSSCTSLVNLEIERCKKLISLADVDVTSLQSLSDLTIRYCEKLQYLPTGLRTLTRLKNLCIGGFWEELDSFPVLQIPSSLALDIYGWPKLKSLPQVINHWTSPVTRLRIYECDGLETLPEWLGDLTSLYGLHICNCTNLKSLPSAQAMQHLTKLEFLRISGCPFLRETCARGTGTEWPKISHNPKIKIFFKWG